MPAMVVRATREAGVTGNDSSRGKRSCLDETCHCEHTWIVVQLRRSSWVLTSSERAHSTSSRPLRRHRTRSHVDARLTDRMAAATGDPKWLHAHRSGTAESFSLHPKCVSAFFSDDFGNAITR